MCYKQESEVNRRSYIWTCIEKWWRQDGDSDSVWWHDHSLQCAAYAVFCRLQWATGARCIVCCWAAVAPLSHGSDGLLSNFLVILMGIMALVMLSYYKYIVHTLDYWIWKLEMTNICVYIFHVQYVHYLCTKYHYHTHWHHPLHLMLNWRQWTFGKLQPKMLKTSFLKISKHWLLVVCMDRPMFHPPLVWGTWFWGLDNTTWLCVKIVKIGVDCSWWLAGWLTRVRG